MSGSVPLRRLYAFMEFTGTTLPLPLPSERLCVIYRISRPIRRPFSPKNGT
jgi:hypothetical protein